MWKIRKGDLEGVKAVLATRRGSPFDVGAITGAPVLLVATWVDRSDICQLLLQAGADPYHTDYAGRQDGTMTDFPHIINDSNTFYRSAVEHTWVNVHGKTYNDQTAKAMQKVMPSWDPEDFAFTPLHKAVLEISSDTVEHTLQQTSLWTVDVQDAWGRNALAWAARRGDFQTMTLLLRHHANLHVRDYHQGSCLFEAIRSGSLDCVRLLLENGVDINQLNGMGSVACTSLCAKMVDLILEYGPELDHQGVDSDSALLTALEYSQFETARKLILHGVNIHLKEKSGFNALSIAVLLNAHAMISLLLERKADHHGPIKQHGTFLHLIAETADVRTLELLTDRLAKRDVQSRRGDGKTAAEVGKSRNLEDIKWQNTFFAFMESVDNTKTRVSPFDYDVRVDVVQAKAEESDEEEDVFVDALE